MFQSRTTFRVLVCCLVTGLFVFSACSAAISTSTPSVKDTVGDLFTQTAQSPLSVTATMQAAFQQAVEATRVANIQNTLTESWNIPGFGTVFYLPEWKEGMNSFPRKYYVDLVSGETTHITPVSLGNDPTVALKTMLSSWPDQSKLRLGTVQSVSIDGHSAAYVEMDLATDANKYNGRVIFAIVFIPKTNSYVQVIIGTADKTTWSEIKPIAEATLLKIKLVD